MYIPRPPPLTSVPNQGLVEWWGGGVTFQMGNDRIDRTALSWAYDLACMCKLVLQTLTQIQRDQESSACRLCDNAGILRVAIVRFG